MRSEEFYRKACDVCRVALGEAHPSYATNLDNLALLYMAKGDYAAAEPLHRRANHIFCDALCDGHPDYALSLTNLSTLYDSMGNYAASEPLHRQAMEITRAALGEGHPNYATSLNNLSMVYASTNRADEARRMMEKAAAVEDRIIGQIFSVGSEEHRAALLKSIQVNQARFLWLVWQHLAKSPEAVQSALDLVLRRKAIGAEALAAQRDAVLGGKYPHLIPRLGELSLLARQIAQKSLAGPGMESPQSHRQILDEWRARKERLEAELARQVPEMNLEKKLRAADRRAVALGLPEAVALIEFVHFDVQDLDVVPAHSERRWGLARYLAFVLAGGEPDAVRMIDLGEAGPIDRMIADFRAGITGEAGGRNVRDMRKRPSGLPPTWQSAGGRALRAAVFDKLVPELGGRRRLLLATDGDLARLSFEVLPDDDGRLVVDDYDLSYLGCGRDVLRFGAESTGLPGEALIVADPDFDLGGEAAPAPSLPSASRGRLSRDLGALRFPVNRLPATRAEGERIAAFLGVDPWLGADVLEGRLKAECRSPRILHLATHGFFIEDQKNDPKRGGPMLGDHGRLMAPLPENPLLRSGLILAGVNTWHRTGTFHEGAEDGLLTAEDVSGLDLLATELVVLSACETGLGEVRTGEGVFGLQRAFTLAGANTDSGKSWHSEASE